MNIRDLFGCAGDNVVIVANIGTNKSDNCFYDKTTIVQLFGANIGHPCLHYFVLQYVTWVVARSLPRNVRYVAAECLASVFTWNARFFFFLCGKGT